MNKLTIKDALVSSQLHQKFRTGRTMHVHDDIRTLNERLAGHGSMKTSM